MNGLTPEIVDLTTTGVSANDLWIHNEQDKTKANLLARMFDAVVPDVHFPRPFGVLFAEERPVYEEMMQSQIENAKAKKGEPNLDSILSGDKTWTIN